MVGGQRCQLDEVSLHAGSQEREAWLYGDQVDR